jgi:GAF domain-containing protein
MAIPLISRDAIVGVITLMHSVPQHFTEEHERLLADAADQVALALDNARIFDTMTRLTDRLSLLYEIGQMATQLDLDSAVAQAVRAIRASTGWPTVAAFFLDEDHSPILRASVGDSVQAILEHKWPSGEGLMARAISIALPLRNCEGASAMVAPVRIGQRVLGMLGVYNAEPDCYTNEDMELLSSVADMLAMAVAYAELSKR